MVFGKDKQNNINEITSLFITTAVKDEESLASQRSAPDVQLDTQKNNLTYISPHTCYLILVTYVQKHLIIVDANITDLVILNYVMLVIKFFV